MKKEFLAGTLAIMMLFGMSSAMSAQDRVRINGGPGIVMAGSQNYNNLPKEARTFIEKHFKGENVVKCEEFFAKRKYEVELSNGVDIDFDMKGKVKEIDAPDNMCLPVSVVKALIHGNAFKRLEKDGLSTRVESVEFNKRNKIVEIEFSIPSPDTYIFDINGNFIAISD